MFARPVSRAARGASTKTLPINPISVRTVTPHAPSTPGHQRRHSSSKTAYPPGTPRGPEAATRNSATSPNEHTEHSQDANPHKKQATRIPKKKIDRQGTAERAAVKARDEAFANLPAVPPTTHLSSRDVHVSALFAMHRPISVTRPYPPPSPDAAFESLFETRQGHRPTDVIYTISNAVSALDGNQSARDEKDLRWEILQQSSSNSDSRQMRQTERPAPSLEELVKQFRPFNTPPAPVPMGDLSKQHHPQQTPSDQHQHTELDDPSDKHFTTTLTITEHTLPSGEQEYSASTGPFVQRHGIPFAPRQPFLSRLQARQDRFDEHLDRTAEQQGRGMYAISVKRQRKLKMKKHKYKKLMRRTRNLRRREGRT